MMISLDHVTIRASDLKATKDFMIKVFDLVERPRPKVIQRIPGHWLFSNNQPVVHLIYSYGNPVDITTDGIDHVGFKLTGYHNFKKKLSDLGISFSLMDIEELQERRIFFHTPEGVLLEGVFHENN